MNTPAQYICLYKSCKIINNNNVLKYQLYYHTSVLDLNVDENCYTNTILQYYVLYCTEILVYGTIWPRKIPTA